VIDLDASLGLRSREPRAPKIAPRKVEFGRASVRCFFAAKSASVRSSSNRTSAVRIRLLTDHAVSPAASRAASASRSDAAMR